MSKPLERLESEVLGLSQAERARLAHVILLSLEHEPFEEPEAVEAAWAKEIERRVEDVRTGRVKTIPGEEVFREIEGLTK